MSDQKVVTVLLMGGLGNQLFQLFACISYGIRTSRRIILPYAELLTTGTIRPTYWDNLFKTIKHMTTYNNAQYKVDDLSLFPSFHEDGYRFAEIASFDVPKVQLYGYFQSPKYFQDHYDTICSLMNLPAQILRVRNYYAKYFAENVHTISMHFRIGDYKNIQNYHPLMPVQYYVLALNRLRRSGSECNVLYFCEEKDLDTVTSMIAEIKTMIYGVHFVRADSTISDWEQMLLMASCNDNIIANSTFSWWGAYLNQTPNKQVCYPNKWFGPSAKHDTTDLFPEEWQRIMW